MWLTTTKIKGSRHYSLSKSLAGGCSAFKSHFFSVTLGLDPRVQIKNNKALYRSFSNQAKER